MKRVAKRLLWLALFPVILLIVNPLNDATGAVRDWWEAF